MRAGILTPPAARTRTRGGWDRPRAARSGRRHVRPVGGESGRNSVCAASRARRIMRPGPARRPSAGHLCTQATHAASTSGSPHDRDGCLRRAVRERPPISLLLLRRLPSRRSTSPRHQPVQPSGLDDGPGPAARLRPRHRTGPRRLPLARHAHRPRPLRRCVVHAVRTLRHPGPAGGHRAGAARRARRLAVDRHRRQGHRPLPRGALHSDADPRRRQRQLVLRRRGGTAVDRHLDGAGRGRGRAGPSASTRARACRTTPCSASPGTARGRVWVATSVGARRVARRPPAADAGVTRASREPQCLLFDGSGALWVGAASGLYRVEGERITSFSTSGRPARELRHGAGGGPRRQRLDRHRGRPQPLA